MNSGTVETNSISRDTLARHICTRIDEEFTRVRQQWDASAAISHFVIDDVLPKEWAQKIAAAFPPSGSMMLRRSLRELKYVSAQMNAHDPMLEEALFAFQAPSVLERVQQITGLRGLEPDELLYAGGISVMGPSHFLNPHIDNSHDKSRSRYRVLNLLYYASPDWRLENGGNLELWPDGPQGKPVTVASSFNRLVVMVTHQRSWHSVSPITASANRCCVSNYYFSRFPAGDAEYFHVTSFRGRPEQTIRDLALRADGLLRGWVRKLFPQGVRETRHYYKGKDR